MNFEWVVTGIILLGGMLACGISLYIKRRRESKNPDLYGSKIRPDFYEEESDD